MSLTNSKGFLSLFKPKKKKKIAGGAGVWPLSSLLCGAFVFLVSSPSAFGGRIGVAVSSFWGFVLPGLCGVDSIFPFLLILYCRGFGQ
jgi:hypothetical protein